MGYSSAQAKAFINEIAPIIQKEAKERGYKVCSPVIAQAICESRANTSSLSKKYHNYFGLKCGSAWKGKSINLSTKEEYTVGTLTNIRDNFRVYDSMEAGVKGYFDFISTNRYKNLKTAESPLEYLNRIKADGYATSSTYVSTNINIVNKYNLAKYDFGAVQGEHSNDITIDKYPTLRKGNSGLWVVYLQQKLVAKGHTISVDGEFGNNTKSAVIAFQGMNNLVKDGIVGRKTWEKLEA